MIILDKYYIEGGIDLDTGLSIIDIIMRILFLGIIPFILVILLLVWRFSKGKKEQLNRIEEKLDSLQKKN